MANKELKNDENLIAKAVETLKLEAACVNKLAERVGGEFAAACRLILAAKGRVIVTGMGKSGHIGRKIAASLASTGTPAFFLHPGEAFHGDLGMVTADDIIIAISNSGETNEIINIIPTIRRIGAHIIAVCGRKESALVKNADYFLDAAVEKEAGPIGLAPTCSTTAALAIGDALTVALLSERNFTAQDFAVFHPGGSLGRKLLLTVEAVMRKGDDNAVISGSRPVREALFLMTKKGTGATSVTDGDGKFTGLLTDGDIRRALAQSPSFLDEPVANLMTKNPLTIVPERLATAAISLMEKHQPRPVTVLPVIDAERRPVGLIHITDLMRQGVV